MVPSLRLGDLIVQLVEINAVEIEAFQACVHGIRDELADVAGRFDQYLGADNNLRPFQRLQHAAEIAFGHAVAVHRCGVVVIDSEFHGARDCALLVCRRAFHHQAANGAAAEAQHRKLQTGFA